MLSFNGTPLSHPLFLKLRIFAEEGVERFEDPDWVDDCKQKVYSRHRRAVEHVNSQKLRHHVEGPHKLTPGEKSQCGGKGVLEDPLSTRSYWQLTAAGKGQVSYL